MSKNNKFLNCLHIIVILKQKNRVMGIPVRYREVQRKDFKEMVQRPLWSNWTNCK
jgi:hypothetical protein